MSFIGRFGAVSVSLLVEMGSVLCQKLQMRPAVFAILGVVVVAFAAATWA